MRGLFWSALTCQRFGRLRPVAAWRGVSLTQKRRQAAANQSGDRSPHSKNTGLFGGEFLQVFRRAAAQVEPVRKKLWSLQPYSKPLRNLLRLFFLALIQNLAACPQQR